MRGELIRNIEGIPSEIFSLIDWVPDKKRKNPLSLQPGGSDVVVEYHNGNVFGYDKIKYPSKYVGAIIAENYPYGKDEYSYLSEEDQIEFLRTHIKRIYARSYDDDYEYGDVHFSKAWDYETSEVTVDLALSSYDMGNTNRSNTKNISQYEFVVDQESIIDIEVEIDEGGPRPDDPSWAELNAQEYSRRQRGTTTKPLTKLYYDEDDDDLPF